MVLKIRDFHWNYNGGVEMINIIVQERLGLLSKEKKVKINIIYIIIGDFLKFDMLRR